MTRPLCSLCHLPLGSAKCAHAWIRDGEVTMSVVAWHALLATSDRFRRAVIRLDPDGYENDEYAA